MNKTIIAIIILVILIIAGGYLLLRIPEAQAPLGESSPTTSGVPVPNTETSKTVVIPTPPTKNTPSKNAVAYNNTGYSPSALSVKVGTIVIFQNNSSFTMWPASAFHPTHAVYPTTGGCIGSTFDACKGIQPGGSWLFKFDIAGNWKYHDHLKPNYFGTIVVE